MSNRKKLQDLTIRDNFMFAAVMVQKENCKRLLEMLLNIRIERIDISYEKSIIYNPEYKGVRLDVYARDEKNTRYDVEMQVVREELGKRSRYYHSQMDMDLLLSGQTYDELPEAYVIFICDFDPFGQRKYCYTFENRCLELPQLSMGDGSRSLFLNTRGENREEISEEVEAFLNFIREDVPGLDIASKDAYVRQLQESIRSVKKNREMERQYMLLEDLLREERKAAEARGEAKGEIKGEIKAKRNDILELAEELGAISEALYNRIMSETDAEKLKVMLKAAAKADSLEQFEHLISNL